MTIYFIIIIILILEIIKLIYEYHKLDITNLKNFKFALKLYEENIHLKKKLKEKKPLSKAL